MSPKKEPYNVQAIEEACKVLGNGSKLAKAIKVDYKTVFSWRHGKVTPSPLNCVKIEKATLGYVKREDVRPHFDWNNFKLF